MFKLKARARARMWGVDVFERPRLCVDYGNDVWADFIVYMNGGWIAQPIRIGIKR